MGCASSSPIVNGEGVDGVHSAKETMAESSMEEKARSATNTAIEAGEQVLNDAGNAITESVGAVENSVTDAVSSVKQGMGNVMSSGMAFMKSTSNAVTEKAEEMGEDLMAAGNDLMQHVPLKDQVGDAVEDLMAEKAKEVDQMADDLMADTEDMVKDMGAGMEKMLGGLPNVSNSHREGAMDEAEGMMGMMMGDGKISSKTPIQSMDSFKTGSPEPELQKLEEMSMDQTTVDSPKPSNNVLELVDLEEAPPTPAMSTNGMEITSGDITQPPPLPTTEATTASINDLPVPLVTLPNGGVSTPADTLLLGEVIGDESLSAIEGNLFLLPPPSPRHDGVPLTEPTQWERFADSIVKSHLDKTLRRGVGISSANATVAPEEGNSNTTEQNIEL